MNIHTSHQGHPRPVNQLLLTTTETFPEPGLSGTVEATCSESGRRVLGRWE